MQSVLKCAEEAGFATLDLFPTIDEGVRKQGLWTIFRIAHPSAGRRGAGGPGDRRRARQAPLLASP